MPLALRYAARSDVGLVRKGNEDSGYAGPRLLVVADGMGGHAAGELASATAVATLAGVIDGADDQDEALASLATAVESAGASIGLVVADNPDLAGMGTTTTALYWLDDRVAVVHVGDSRAYLLRDGELTQMTHDHTYVQTLIDAGRITPDEAAVHPRRSLLMRAIDGVQPVEPDLSVLEAREGDRYLICSDGLTTVVRDDEVQQVLSEGDPTGTVTSLVELALSRGAPDNVTVVVADVVDIDGDRVHGLTDGEAVVVGAAGEPRVRARLPRVHFPKDAQVDPNRPDAPPDFDSGPPTAELPLIDAAATVTRSPRSRRGLRIAALVVGIAVAVAAVIAVASVAWVRSQWYVGISGNNVTIYQGVPGTAIGVPLQSAISVTDLTITQLPIFDAALVTNGIVADGEAGAQRIVDDLRTRAAECAVVPTPSGCPTPTVTPTVTP